MDNAGWSNYNFKYLFEEGGTPSVLERTQKLLVLQQDQKKILLFIVINRASIRANKSQKLV